LCGREDSWSTLPTHKDIAARIRGSKLAIVENAGHMAPMERPEKVTAALVTWLESLSEPIC
jgi:pimeloyl-ACP methyl ester carboxylesterase